MPPRHQLIQGPAPIDPMRSLSDILSIAENMNQFQGRQRERASKDRVDAARAKYQDDPKRVVDDLRGQGQYGEATAYLDQHTNRMTEAVNAIGARVGQHKTIYGKAAQIIPEMQARPDLYQQFRPQLLDLATSIDPSLAAKIPQDYDAAALSELLQGATDSAAAMEAMEKATKAANQKLATKEMLAKHDEYDREIVGNRFSFSPNQEDWDAAIQQTRALGIGDDWLSKVGPTWSPEAQERARQLLLTGDQRAPKEDKEPTPGDFEDYVTRVAKAQGKTVEQLSTKDIRTARAEYEGAGRAPKDADDPGLALTPAALDLTAKQFAMTGLLPPMGMGAKAATSRTQIINRAAELFEGLDLASQKAAYDANKKSLAGLQVQRDAIGAFEETALKNLEQFVTQAKKVVDTGSPLVNRPLRAFAEGVMGSPDMVAYNVARRTVIPEFAKILANPGLSGQLSDSARKEIEDVLNGNATLAQTLAATSVLVQDTKNRRTSYDDQIKAIQTRIATPPGGADAGRLRVKGPNGETGTVPAGTTLPAGWSKVE